MNLKLVRGLYSFDMFIIFAYWFGNMKYYLFVLVSNSRDGLF